MYFLTRTTIATTNKTRINGKSQLVFTFIVDIYIIIGIAVFVFITVKPKVFIKILGVLLKILAKAKKFIKSFFRCSMVGVNKYEFGISNA